MKVLISADMEGTAGVSSWTHVTAPETGGPGRNTSQAEYDRARLRMTREVNAAIEGAHDAGATGAIVNDAHSTMRNLVPEDLHPEAQLVSGADKPLVMMQGIDEPDIGCVFFTGFHARAGTPAAPLAHTWDLGINDVRVNGVSIGEYGINAYVAGHFNVPVAFVAGDDKAVAQTRELLGEQVVGVVVKHGISETSARHLSPIEAIRRIRDGASRAVENRGVMRPFRLDEDSYLEVDFDHQTRASRAAEVPGVAWTGWRTVGCTVADGIEMHRYFRAITRAADTV